MTVEIKNCSGGLIELDGVPVNPAPETKAGGLQDKAVWPQRTDKHRSEGIQPGHPGYLRARQVAAKIRDLEQRLETLRQERKTPVPADHPIVRRVLRLLRISDRRSARR